MRHTLDCSCSLSAQCLALHLRARLFREAPAFHRADVVVRPAFSILNAACVAMTICMSPACAASNHIWYPSTQTGGASTLLCSSPLAFPPCGCSTAAQAGRSRPPCPTAAAECTRSAPAVHALGSAASHNHTPLVPAGAPSLARFSFCVSVCRGTLYDGWPGPAPLTDSLMLTGEEGQRAAQAAWLLRSNEGLQRGSWCAAAQMQLAVPAGGRGCAASEGAAPMRLPIGSAAMKGCRRAGARGATDTSSRVHSTHKHARGDSASCWPRRNTQVDIQAGRGGSRGHRCARRCGVQPVRAASGGPGVRARAPGTRRGGPRGCGRRSHGCGMLHAGRPTGLPCPIPPASSHRDYPASSRRNSVTSLTPPDSTVRWLHADEWRPSTSAAASGAPATSAASGVTTIA
jgi:hypothetical protein